MDGHELSHAVRVSYSSIIRPSYSRVWVLTYNDHQIIWCKTNNQSAQCFVYNPFGSWPEMKSSGRTGFGASGERIPKWTSMRWLRWYMTGTSRRRKDVAEVSVGLCLVTKGFTSRLRVYLRSLTTNQTLTWHQHPSACLQIFPETQRVIPLGQGVGATTRSGGFVVSNPVVHDGLDVSIRRISSFWSTFLVLSRVQAGEVAHEDEAGWFSGTWLNYLQLISSG